VVEGKKVIEMKDRKKKVNKKQQPNQDCVEVEESCCYYACDSCGCCSAYCC
jgi:hypothetical protein